MFLTSAASHGNLLVHRKAGGVTGLKVNTKPVSVLVTHLRTKHPLCSSPSFPNQRRGLSSFRRGEHPNVRAPIRPGVLVESEMEAEGSGIINLL